MVHHTSYHNWWPLIVDKRLIMHCSDGMISSSQEFLVSVWDNERGQSNSVNVNHQELLCHPKHKTQNKTKHKSSRITLSSKTLLACHKSTLVSSLIPAPPHCGTSWQDIYPMWKIYHCPVICCQHWCPLSHPSTSCWSPFQRKCQMTPARASRDKLVLVQRKRKTAPHELRETEPF